MRACQDNVSGLSDLILCEVAVSQIHEKNRKMVNSSELSPNVNSLDIAMETRAESLIEKLVIFTAIIVYQSVPYRCIDRVVSYNGDRITFQRVLTPRPGPRVTLRDTWIPQQQQKEQQPQPQYSDSGNCSGKAIASGGRKESGNCSVKPVASE